jgi:hypothetical protein
VGRRAGRSARASPETAQQRGGSRAHVLPARGRAREIILVACSKCEWKAAFRRDELITAHGAACSMPSLLCESAPPSRARDRTTRTSVAPGRDSAAFLQHLPGEART